MIHDNSAKRIRKQFLHSQRQPKKKGGPKDRHRTKRHDPIQVHIDRRHNNNNNNNLAPTREVHSCSPRGD